MADKVSTEATAAKAAALRAMHHAPELLVLPNAWDAATAKSVAAAGFGAVASTSAGVSLSLGYGDGEAAPLAEMLAADARIIAAVHVPVTIDFEAGYQLEPREVAKRLIAIGAAGLNYEDTDHYGDAKLLPPDAQAERIASLKAAAYRTGVDLVINARVDVFIHKIGGPDEQLADGLKRAELYRQAGADCIYPILLTDEAALAAFVAAGHVVNTNVRLGGPLTLKRAKELGLRRVSYAGGLFRESIMHFEAALETIKSEI